MAELSVAFRIIRAGKVRAKPLRNSLRLSLRCVPGNGVGLECEYALYLPPDLHLGPVERHRTLVSNLLRFDIQVPSINYTGKGHA